MGDSEKNFEALANKLEKGLGDLDKKFDALTTKVDKSISDSISRSLTKFDSALSTRINDLKKELLNDSKVKFYAHESKIC